jgi:hypothetical protein
MLCTQLARQFAYTKVGGDIFFIFYLKKKNKFARFSSFHFKQLAMTKQERNKKRGQNQQTRDRCGCTSFNTEVI